MKIIPLGTNGFFPSYGRQTASFAIPHGETLIMLDAGSGLFRLAEPAGQNLIKKAKEVQLFLSHYHLDHTFGFYAAFQFFKHKKVTIFGSQTKQVFSEFPRLRHFPIDYAREHGNFVWKLLKTGENKISDYKVQVRQQHHRGEGSLAFRFEFSNGANFAYVTDSEPSREGIKFVRNADILLHEHEEENEQSKYKKGIELEKLYNGGHVTTAGAALIAGEANVKKLYLIHHNPYADDGKLKNELKTAKQIFKNSFLAGDLEEINF